MYISGIVIPGTQQARLLGFPTANVACAPREEVVSLCAILVDGVQKRGVGTYLAYKACYEVHIFDYDKDLYGQTLVILPLCTLRPNKKFISGQELREQILVDIQIANNLLSDYSHIQIS